MQSYYDELPNTKKKHGECGRRSYGDSYNKTVKTDTMRSVDNVREFMKLGSWEEAKMQKMDWVARRVGMHSCGYREWLQQSKHYHT